MARINPGYYVVEDEEVFSITVTKYSTGGNNKFIRELKELIEKHKAVINKNNANSNSENTPTKTTTASATVIVVTEKIRHELEMSMTSGKSLKRKNLKAKDYPVLHCTRCKKELTPQQVQRWFYHQNAGLCKEDPRRLDPLDHTINYDAPEHHHYCSDCYEHFKEEREINYFRRSFRHYKYQAKKRSR